MKINNKNVDIYNINQKKLILPKYSIYLNEHPKVKKSSMKSSNKPWTRVGAIQFVAGTAKERVRKATQVADAIGGHSKEKQWTVHWKQPRRLTKRLEMQ